MPTSRFEGCDDSCGWIAAIVAALAYGSYGVAIKASLKVDVDPLVMQSYKTLMFFACSWLVPWMGEEIRFTPWGIVSGLIWVPGSMCGIFAIRNAGMAVATGTWASFIVIMNFFWGIIVFQERVKSLPGTCCSFLLLMIGLVGMSIFSHDSNKVMEDDHSKKKIGIPVTHSSDIRKRSTEMTEDYISPMEIESLVDEKDDDAAEKDRGVKDRIVICGGRIALTMRQCGVLAAVCNGIWGGTTLIPMHYAHNEGFSRAGFLVSYASGSLMVTVGIWAILFMVRLYQKGCSIRKAITAMPEWHIKELWLPGMLAGLLLSIGVFASVLAIAFLGQGVGNSVIQVKILVSGMWGICYFKEIKQKETIVKWFLSAGLAVAGILWLSYEHESSRGHR